MDPLSLMALLSGGMSLFGGLTSKDPYQQWLQQVQRFANPNQIGADTQNFYRQFLNSPAFSAAQAGNIAGSNLIRNQLQGRLGASGMGSSGIGAAASAMGASSLAPLMSQLYSSGWQNSSQMASDLARMRLGGMSGGPQPFNMGGNIMGAGLSGLGDVLRLFLSRMPQGGQQSGFPSGYQPGMPSMPWLGGYG